MRRRAYSAYIILALVAIHALPLLAQEPTKAASQLASEGPAATEDLTRWWTLTDEITPQELRSIHQDTELTKARYREAVEAGNRQFLPEKRLQSLHFFIDGGTHPELFQMWSVFDAFASSFGSPEDDPRGSLANFGFEGQVLEEIIHFCSEYWRQKEGLMEKAMADRQPVLEFIRLGRERLGEEGFKTARQGKDVSGLANVTGYDAERIKEFFELSKQTPGQDFAIRALPLLKEILSPADWNRFRSYLLEVQAAMMSSISTAVLGGN